MRVKVRIPLPPAEELSSYAIAAAGHLVLLAVLFGIIGTSSSTGALGPSMTVRLAAGAPRGGVLTGTTTRQAPKPAPQPEPPKPKAKPSVRVPAQQPKNIVTRPTGATAQPEQLPSAQPKPAPKPSTGETAPGGQEEGGPLRGMPGLPQGPIAGGIAGVTTDEPLGADWYVGLIVNRLQDAWSDRPLLPEGEGTKRVVVSFVIQRDGRVTDAEVQTPSGYSPLDTSALRAVLALGRIPPLPASYGKDKLRARFVFELVPPSS